MTLPFRKGLAGPLTYDPMTGYQPERFGRIGEKRIFPASLMLLFRLVSILKAPLRRIWV